MTINFKNVYINDKYSILGSTKYNPIVKENVNKYVDDSENFVGEYDNDLDEISFEGDSWINNVPETATEVIEEFFNRLSNRQFDEAFALMVPAVRDATEIRSHFGSIRSSWKSPC